MDIIEVALGMGWLGWLILAPLVVVIVIFLWDYISDRVWEASWDFFHRDPPDKNKGH